MTDQKPDGVMEVVVFGNTSTIEYYIQKGVPMEASIHVYNDDVDLSMREGVGVGINHKSNVPVKVLNIVENHTTGQIETVRVQDQDIKDDLSDNKWDVETVDSFEY